MDVLGIDLAKQTFDVTLLTTCGTRRYRQFPNTAKGCDQVQRWVTRQGVTQVHACMEATNVYWETLATALHGHGHTVSVVNPACIKGFAQSQLQRNKTDKQDSATIATFCAQTQPTPWTPPTAAQRTLRALVRHRDDLIATRIQQQNRLNDTREPAVRTSLEVVLDTLTAQQQAVEQQITDHLAAHADLRDQHALLVTIPGIGPVTAHKLLAELYDIAAYPSANAVAADAGVTPAHYQSGTSVRRQSRLSKLGKAGVRGALYWPAIAAMTHNHAFKQFAQRLADRGKPKPVIQSAVMRKLLHVVYGVLKHQAPFDADNVLGPVGATT
jgi:transposase